VFAGLLRRYINEKEPDTEVVFVDTWSENLPVQATPNTILLLDEAQTTYWDKNFWSKFKNPGLQDMRIVAFASHGSSGYTGADNVTPIRIGMELLVGLILTGTGSLLAFFYFFLTHSSIDERSCGSLRGFDEERHLAQSKEPFHFCSD